MSLFERMENIERSIIDNGVTSITQCIFCYSNNLTANGRQIRDTMRKMYTHVTGRTGCNHHDPKLENSYSIFHLKFITTALGDMPFNSPDIMTAIRRHRDNLIQQENNHLNYEIKTNTGYTRNDIEQITRHWEKTKQLPADAPEWVKVAIDSILQIDNYQIAADNAEALFQFMEANA